MEERTYKFISKVGEIQPRLLPDQRMIGAVATLKNKGLVEVYKRYTSIYRRKKKNFVKITEHKGDEITVTK
jgi:hypothetical protein